MKLFFTFLFSCIFANESILLKPPSSVSSKHEAAIVWIVGAGSETLSYKKLALETQKQAADRGLKLWIHIPAFKFDYPKPLEIDVAMSNSVDSLCSAGFPQGNKMFVCAHSLGTVISQWYLAIHNKQFSGFVMMGGGLTRDRY